MIFADVKANKNNKKKKIWLLCSLTNFKIAIPSKLEIQYKRGMYFSFGFGWYTVYFDSVS